MNYKLEKRLKTKSGYQNKERRKEKNVKEEKEGTNG